MTVRHLKVFVCVCKHSSITKAAEEIFVAQPAISNTISEIEKHYNIILFNRINQRLHITEEGKLLLLKAKEVLSAFEEFELQAQRVSVKPLLKIGSSITIGKQQIPNLIKTVKENYSDINIQISVNQTAVIEEKIADGNLDFAFIQGKPANTHIKSKLVAKNRLIAVCGTNFPIPESLTLKELCKYDLLLREDGSVSREFLSQAWGSHNINVTPVMESVSNQALISAARENLGVTILPEALILSRIKRGQLKKIEITDCEFSRNVYIIYHKNKSFGGVKKDVFEFCRKNFESDKKDVNSN